MSNRPLPPRMSRRNEAEFADGNQSMGRRSPAGNGRGRDLLGQLQAARPTSVYNSSNALLDASPANGRVNELLGIINESDDKLQAIKGDISQVKKLHSLYFDAVGDNESYRVSSEIDQYELRARKGLSSLHKNMPRIEASINESLQRGTADYATVYNQLIAHKSRYQRILEDLHKTQVQFSQAQKNRFIREVRVVQPDVTDAEIEEMLESGENIRVFAQSIQNSSRYQDATRVLDNVKSRQADIAKLVKSIVEINQLFIQMEELLTVQDHQITRVELHADEAVTNLEDGRAEVEQAIVHRKSQIGLLWCIVVVVVLILGGLAAWFFYFRNKV